MRDDPTFHDRTFFARLRSKLLAPADVVEAVYCGEDPTFAGMVGSPAIWVVVGELDGIAELVPHGPQDPKAQSAEVRRAPLTDFRAVTKIATLLDRLH